MAAPRGVKTTPIAANTESACRRDLPRVFWGWRAGEGVAKMALKIPIWVRDPQVSNRPLPDVQVVLIKEVTRRWQTISSGGAKTKVFMDVSYTLLP
jgi:hypothetical protein